MNKLTPREIARIKTLWTLPIPVRVRKRNWKTRVYSDNDRYVDIFERLHYRVDKKELFNIIEKNKSKIGDETSDKRHLNVFKTSGGSDSCAGATGWQDIQDGMMQIRQSKDIDEKTKELETDKLKKTLVERYNYLIDPENNKYGL